MKKNKYNRKKVLIFLAILISILLIFFLPFLFFPEEKQIEDKTVKYADATVIYQKLYNKCQGAYVWNIQKYQSTAINYEDIKSNCKNNYVSRLYAFTSNNEEVLLDIKILEVDNGKLYDLDKTYVADYNINTLNDDLEKGSIYRYSFKNDKNYTLNYVERTS